jgi:hypothetical protein
VYKCHSLYSVPSRKLCMSIFQLISNLINHKSYDYQTFTLAIFIFQYHKYYFLCQNVPHFEENHSNLRLIREHTHDFASRCFSVHRHLTPDRLNMSEQSALSLHSADQATRTRNICAVRCFLIKHCFMKTIFVQLYLTVKLSTSEN